MMAAVEPVPAASLVLHWSDRAGVCRYLLGRRSAAHRFMPLVYVFPGGRVDETDVLDAAKNPGRTAVRVGDGADLSGLRFNKEAFLVAAYRELEEETGLRIGRDLKSGELPLLFARAVTPESQPIRYDTLFFSQAIESAGLPLASLLPPSDQNELDNLGWRTKSEFERLETAPVTRWVFSSLKAARQNLSAGIPAGLSAGAPAGIFKTRP